MRDQTTIPGTEARFGFRMRATSRPLIRSLLANPDFADLKGASAGDDFIEHLRQNERIDDVAAQLDGLGRHRRNLAKERGGAS